MPILNIQIIGDDASYLAAMKRIEAETTATVGRVGISFASLSASLRGVTAVAPVSASTISSLQLLSSKQPEIAGVGKSVALLSSAIQTLPHIPQATVTAVGNLAAATAAVGAATASANKTPLVPPKIPSGSVQNLQLTVQEATHLARLGGIPFARELAFIARSGGIIAGVGAALFALRRGVEQLVQIKVLNNDLRTNERDFSRSASAGLDYARALESARNAAIGTASASSVLADAVGFGQLSGQAKLLAIELLKAGVAVDDIGSSVTGLLQDTDKDFTKATEKVKKLATEFKDLPDQAKGVRIAFELAEPSAEIKGIRARIQREIDIVTPEKNIGAAVGLFGVTGLTAASFGATQIQRAGEVRIKLLQEQGRIEEFNSKNRAAFAADANARDATAAQQKRQDAVRTLLAETESAGVRRREIAAEKIALEQGASSRRERTGRQEAGFISDPTLRFQREKEAIDRAEQEQIASERSRLTGLKSERDNTASDLQEIDDVVLEKKIEAIRDGSSREVFAVRRAQVELDQARSQRLSGRRTKVAAANLESANNALFSKQLSVSDAFEGQITEARNKLKEKLRKIDEEITKGTATQADKELAIRDETASELKVLSDQTSREKERKGFDDLKRDGQFAQDSLHIRQDTARKLREIGFEDRPRGESERRGFAVQLAKSDEDSIRSEISLLESQISNETAFKLAAKIDDPAFDDAIRDLKHRLEDAQSKLTVAVAVRTQADNAGDVRRERALLDPNERAQFDRQRRDELRADRRRDERLRVFDLNESLGGNATQVRRLSTIADAQEASDRVAGAEFRSTTTPITTSQPVSVSAQTVVFSAGSVVNVGSAGSAPASGEPNGTE